MSTRGHDAALEPVDQQTAEKASSTSKSSVSRKFVQTTTERLNQLCSRSPAENRWAIMFVDGTGFGEHTLVVALGVAADGTKVPRAGSLGDGSRGLPGIPVGVAEGSTENKTVCTRLLADLQDRGLDCTRGVLFVIDGSKALDAAIRGVFGSNAVIQRCRRHKEENVLDHLPKAQQPWVRRKLREARAIEKPDAARQELKTLARTLEKKHPGAAASLREGLDATLTVTRLGVTGSLLEAVFSTNPADRSSAAAGTGLVDAGDLP